MRSSVHSLSFTSSGVLLDFCSGRLCGRLTRLCYILFWHSSIIITFGLSVIVTLSCHLFLWMLWIFSDNLNTNYITFIIWGCVDDDLSSSSSRQEFNTSGSSNTDTGKASGSLETKYKMKELGLSFNQKWNTDNTLATEVTVEDQVRVGASPVHTCFCSW